MAVPGAVANATVTGVPEATLSVTGKNMLTVPALPSVTDASPMLMTEAAQGHALNGETEVLNGRGRAVSTMLAHALPLNCRALHSAGPHSHPSGPTGSLGGMNGPEASVPPS